MSLPEDGLSPSDAAQIARLEERQALQYQMLDRRLSRVELVVYATAVGVISTLVAILTKGW